VKSRAVLAVTVSVSVGWLAGGSVAIAGSNAPTGNKAAIAFYRRSESVNASYESIAFSGGGTSYKIVAHAGTEAAKFGFGSTPKGFQHASDQVRVIQRKGVVAEEVDTLSAPGQPSVVVWNEGSSRWVAEVQHPGACVFAVSTFGIYAYIGQPFVQPDGSTFAALQLAHGDEIVRSTYPDEGFTAREVDAINADSGLWVESVTAYGAGSNQLAYLTSMSGFHYSRDSPLIPEPRIGQCK
jgi:hypothetical protein